MGKKCTCNHCHEVFDWEGDDEQTGTIFYCERCGEDFCDNCFERLTGKDFHDVEIFAQLPNEAGVVADCLCPKCFLLASASVTAPVLKESEGVLDEYY